MKLHKFYTLLLLVAISNLGFGQSTIDFSDEIHDFGFILEGEKPSYIFEFENNGEDTLQLENVRPSCGCTIPSWPRRPFSSGETGEINVSYNSKRRPGPFHKSITVTSNSVKPSKRIFIQGVVINGKDLPSDSLQNIYKNKSAGLELKEKKSFLGKVEQNKKLIKTVHVKNTSNQTITIKRVLAGCKCVHVDNAITIEPQETVSVKLNYTPRYLGESNDKIVFLTNDPANPVYEVIMSSSVVESLTTPKGIMMNQHKTGFGF